MLTSQGILSLTIALLIMERFKEALFAQITWIREIVTCLLTQLPILLGKLTQLLSSVMPLLVILGSFLLVLYLTYKTLLRVKQYLKYNSEVRPLQPRIQSHIDITPGVIKSDVNGLYSEIFIGSQQYRLRLETSVSQILLATKQVQPEKEMAISTSRFNEQSILPSGVVALAKEGTIIGMGSRVVVANESYILTALHLNKALLSGDVSVCSSTMQWELNDECSIVKIKDADLLLIKIPTAVWSRLGVKSLAWAEANIGTTVKAYGYTAEQLVFSSGSLIKGPNLIMLKHTASTLPGWSGTPILNNGKVVAVHIGTVASANVNSCVGVYQILKTIEVALQESPIGKFSGKQIEENEMLENNYDFEEYKISGGGKVLAGKEHFSIVKAKLKYDDWYSLADDDDYYENNPPEAIMRKFFGNKETSFEEVMVATSDPLNGPLNHKTVESQVPLSSKPCSQLENIELTQPHEPQSQKACPSMSVERQESHTETLRREKTALHSKKQEKSFPSSMSGVGRKWVQKPSSQVCDTKAQDSTPQKNLRISEKSSQSLPRYTPPPMRPKDVKRGKKKTCDSKSTSR